MQSLGTGSFFYLFNSQTSQLLIFESPILIPSTNPGRRFKSEKFLCRIFACNICKMSTLKQLSLEQGKVSHTNNSFSTSKGNETLLKTSLSFSPKETSTPASLSFETEIKFFKLSGTNKASLETIFSILHCYYSRKTQHRLFLLLRSAFCWHCELCQKNFHPG